MPPYLIGILFLIGLIGLYVLATVINNNTKAPEGCELPDDFHGCSGCSSSGCLSRASQNKDKK